MERWYSTGEEQARLEAEGKRKRELFKELKNQMEAARAVSLFV